MERVYLFCGPWGHWCNAAFYYCIAIARAPHSRFPSTDSVPSSAFVTLKRDVMLASRLNKLLEGVWGAPGRPFRRRKRLNLALQGGGAHGAFTWGVLDQLLADGRIRI